MKILFSFDVEGDFHKYVHSPYLWHKINCISNGNFYNYCDSKINVFLNYLKWKSDLLRGKNRYVKGNKGFINLQSFFEKIKIPVSFALCGHLYLKKCNGYPHFNEKKPLVKWALGGLKKDWYYWDKGSNFKNKPGLYYGNIIQKKSNFDFGLHGFSHEALPLENLDIAKSCICAGIKAAKIKKIKLTHFIPPFNMTKNKENDPVLFDALKKLKILKLRVVGEDNFYNNFKHFKEVSNVKNVRGIKTVNVSNAIEGYFNKKRIIKIIQDIKFHLKKGNHSKKIYCLAGHDYTFKNTNNLRFLVSELKKFEEKGEIEFVNFSMI